MVKLYSKFENLPDEKKKRIMDVCVAEFSRNGYVNASTNNIVKHAEISKGILFHYFGNKKRLYLYIFDHVAKFLTEIIYQRMVDLPADFFERIMKIGIIKIRVAYEYPSEYKFLLEAVMHATEDVKRDVQERYDRLIHESLPFIYKDIDMSKFREDVDRRKAMEIITFALEGVSRKYLKDFRYKPVNEILAEHKTIMQGFAEYGDILKKGIYRS